jgi:hypothetical protein
MFLTSPPRAQIATDAARVEPLRQQDRHFELSCAESSTN